MFISCSMCYMQGGNTLNPYAHLQAHDAVSERKRLAGGNTTNRGLLCHIVTPKL